MAENKNHWLMRFETIGANFKNTPKKTEFKIVKINENLTQISFSHQFSYDSNKNFINDFNIKKSFGELIKCLDIYKEILPFLNNKLENVENENKSLKEQINKFNINIEDKNNELIKIKDKEIEELKNIIENNKNEKEKLQKEKNLIESENIIIKDDIISIGKSTSNEQNGNNDNDEENLLAELLNQLIIIFLKII